jgi:RNA ligase (TIGR02306 family)
MSAFACPVVRVKIEPHPNGDQIELARVGDYLSVVKKGQFKDDDLAVYIPEQSVLPEWMLKQLGFWDEVNGKGKLSGGPGNRVRAARLRGVVSQGLLYPVTHEDAQFCGQLDLLANDTEETAVEFGEDVAVFLGIVKYEPAVPSHMAGRVVGVDFGATHGYDFENLKKTPTLFDDGEDVVITEKIHGTLMSISVVPTEQSNDKYYRGRVVVTSKGMGARGMILDFNDDTNLYIQTAKKHGLMDSMLDSFGESVDEEGRPVFLFGEVFGKTLGGSGVQDLTYTNEPLDYRAFDTCIGNRGDERYAPHDVFMEVCKGLNIKPVPVLYRGPYSKEIVLEHTDGKTTLGNCIREGVVVKSANEDRSRHFGRKIAKSVSNDYLLRKGNTTEFN